MALSGSGTLHLVRRTFRFATTCFNMDFVGVKNGLASKTITLIDVRNTDEVASAGKIPGSHNIPLGQLNDALAMDENAFKAQHGFDKPSKDSPLVTHCLKGGRAAKAHEALLSLGYSKTECYKGSLIDWKENGGEIEQK